MSMVEALAINFIYPKIYLQNNNKVILQKLQFMLKPFQVHTFLKETVATFIAFLKH